MSAQPPGKNRPSPPQRKGKAPAAKSAARLNQAGGGEESLRRPASASADRPPQEKEQAPLLPGVKPVLELLENTPERVDAVFLRKGRHGREMAQIVDLCRSAGVRFSLLDAASFARIYKGNSQGVVARLFEAGFVELDELLTRAVDAPLPLLLVLDQVQDPGNAGTLARTLYAMGGAGLIIPRHNGVYLGAAAAKASAGALERLPVAKPANLAQALEQAKKLGYTVYGSASAPGPAHSETATPGNKNPGPLYLDALMAAPSSFRLPAVLVLGGEETGMRPGVERRCDVLLRIPMLRSFDSLNVAQAGGILISCFVRDRLGKG